MASEKQLSIAERFALLRERTLEVVREFRKLARESDQFVARSERAAKR
jgi:hypothetical protein